VGRWPNNQRFYFENRLGYNTSNTWAITKDFKNRVNSSYRIEWKMKQKSRNKYDSETALKFVSSNVGNCDS